MDILQAHWEWRRLLGHPLFPYIVYYYEKEFNFNNMYNLLYPISVCTSRACLVLVAAS